MLCLRRGVPREENFGFFFTTNLTRDVAEVCENIKKGGAFRDGGMRGEDDIISKRTILKFIGLLQTLIGQSYFVCCD